jgi:hypothetical protein
MILLLITLLASAQSEVETQDIFVAPPTINDPSLESFQPYLNSLLVSSAQSNTHWVKRSNRATGANIHDKHSIIYSQDTVCDYNDPLSCAQENMHWVLITDIFVTPNFATVVVKLYDEEVNLIASASKTSYSIEDCKPQVTQTRIQQLGRPPTEITEKKPDKCIFLDPKVMAKDIKQVVGILFASIHPL